MSSAHIEEDWDNALRRARGHSPFLCNALDRLPELEAILQDADAERAIAFAKNAGAQIGEAGVSLRRERLALSAALAVADLAGAIPVTRVMQELSDFADRALDRAIVAAIAKRVPDEAAQGFIGIALGKHGAQELNYSSDIDPILLYDPDTLPRRSRDEPGEAAQRYAREIVSLLSNNTAEGYVFRVDLRLRPASEVSPLAISLGAALAHYESSALAWERAAYIRARPASGDVAAGQAFLDSVQPFVWRRSLDFGAITEITRLTARIREAYKGPLTPGPGYNVKQGRGGIREIEFYAQTHQLIHGGRDPSLRVRGTRAALDALAAAGRIAAEDAAQMGDAYDRLRTIEHRLQMVNDHQTHTLPDAEALQNVAQLGGYGDAEELLHDITQITDGVAQHFDALINPQKSPSFPAPSGDRLAHNLEQLGFAEPAQLADRVRSWSDGHLRALRSPAAVEAFDAILPTLLEALADAPDPDRAIIRWETFLTKATSAINLFRLLEARPGLLEQLARILTVAGPLADELGRRPDLLDTLIDRSAFDLPGDVASLVESMTVSGGDYERHLDRIRIITSEQRFALGVQLIEAAHDPLDIAAGLSRLAEGALVVAADAAKQEFASVHGEIPGAELAIIGLGRLGGGALTHESDLDLIYLFSGPQDAQSDGSRPLGTTLYFNRLAQRISAALSVPTAHGALYEVDTRLRPQGAQGPLAVSVDSFARYQAQDAWTWEHMALTRARVLVGSPKLCGLLRETIDGVLGQARDPVILRRDVLTMRSEIVEHKPPKGPLDAKLQRGGLVDLEFLTHYLQLRERIAFKPNLGAALECLATQGLLPRTLVEAHAIMTRLLIGARLLAPDLQNPSSAAATVLARACGHEDLDAVMRIFLEARRHVAAQWTAVFETELEIS